MIGLWLDERQCGPSSSCKLRYRDTAQSKVAVWAESRHSLRVPRRKTILGEADARRPPDRRPYRKWLLQKSLQLREVQLLAKPMACTLSETAKVNGVEPQLWLSDAQFHIADHQNRRTPAIVLGWSGNATLHTFGRLGRLAKDPF
jgi:hypothetical protein